MTSKNNAIILGGSGFLGNHLGNLLLKKNFYVTILDNRKSLNKVTNLKFIKCDINNFKNLSKILKNYNYVFNSAGISDLDEANENPLKTINNNINGTVNVLECIKIQKNSKDLFLQAVYMLSVNKVVFIVLQKDHVKT